jgi:hypothetical protein
MDLLIENELQTLYDVIDVSWSGLGVTNIYKSQTWNLIQTRVFHYSKDFTKNTEILLNLKNINLSENNFDVLLGRNSHNMMDLRTPLFITGTRFHNIFVWFDYLLFTSRSRIFQLYGDVTIAGERLQNLGLCLVLRAFEQGGIFIVPHLLWHGTSVYPVSSEGPPHSVASYYTQGDVGDLF